MPAAISTIGMQFRAMGATNVTNKMRTMNTSVIKLSAGIAAFNIAATMGVQAIQEMINVIGHSISAFREFEMRMAEVGTILSDSYGQIERLTKGVEVLSIKFGKATSDMAKGLYDILSAAFSARDALNLLNITTKASIAGLATARESVDIFTTVLNTYGMSVAQATRVSDILFQSVVRGKFQFRDLESSLGYVVPIAAQAGIAFDELMAALSTATRHGLHLDMTARGLALAIQNIINPTEGAQRAAAKYGIDMSALALRAYGLRGFFEDLNEAVQEFGSTIISELIPNMRSMRVAMVLAGDVGLEGLIEDMGLLEEATGRTNEALQKIMATQEFAATVLEQRYEKIQRDFGEVWGEVALAAQAGFLSFLENAGKFVDDLGHVLTTPVTQLLGEAFAEKKVAPMAAPPLDVYEQTQLYIETLTELEKFSTAYDEGTISAEEFNQAFNRLNPILEENEQSFNAITGEIEALNDELFAAKKVLADAESELADLNKALYDTVQYGTQRQFSMEGTLFLERATIEAERERALLLHDIKMGLAGVNYEYDIADEELRKAIQTIRDWDDEMDEARKTTERYNRALKENNLEIMNLQLRGMMRRRGLTRGEQRMMKILRIDSLRTRIESEENIEHKTETEKTAYEEAKRTLEEYTLAANEMVFQLKFGYNDQLDALDALIVDETERHRSRVQMIEDANQDIIDINDATAKAIAEIWKRPELAALLVLGGYGWAKAPEIAPIFKQFFPWKEMFPGQQRGTRFIPQTGLFMGHRGEEIVPRGGRGRGGANVTINIPIKIGTVSSDVDIDRIASQIAYAVKAEYMNADGTTNYDLR